MQEEKHRFLHRKALLSIECNRGIKNEEMPSSFHDTPSIVLIKPINVNAFCLPCVIETKTKRLGSLQIIITDRRFCTVIETGQYIQFC